jgi:opacity protein-like surface antigen
VKTWLVGGVALAVLTGAAWADDAKVVTPNVAVPNGAVPNVAASGAAISPYSWTGFYAGWVAGAAYGRYHNQTSTTPSVILDPAEIPIIAAAGQQTIKSPGFVAGLEGGYNWQVGRTVVGVEADMAAVHLRGAASSGAVSYGPLLAPSAFVVTSYGRTDWLFTARPRLGVLTANDWLLYVTGGLAVTQIQTDFSFVDDLAISETGQINKLRAGYAIGAGIEAPLSANLSVKADYLHAAFPSTTPGTFVNLLVAQPFVHGSDLRADLVRLGLNYHFGAPVASSGTAHPLVDAWPQSPLLSRWDIEVGARVWLAKGREQEGPLFNSPPLTLASLLTYTPSTTTGETFARLDHDSGFFAKGYLGAGGITRGANYDEDFPAGDAYSNTYSSASGHVGYATGDLGYDFVRTPGAKVGLFAGYAYYDQAMHDYGCVQQAASTGSCLPPPDLTPQFEYVTEYDHENAVRLGLASQIMMTDRLRLRAEAAYLPWADYVGLDDHLARQILGPDADKRGSGVMLEAVLDYDVTANWRVGVGARYWTWNFSNNGTSGFNFLTSPATNAVEPSGYSVERYGLFAQSSYRFGDGAPGGVSETAPAASAGPVNWTGVYVGGHIGGGADLERWADPFPTAPSVFGGTNTGGFGDALRVTGALGGGQIGVDWQGGDWVLGLAADVGAARMTGENSCYTGLGGFLCQHTINALGTLTARAGYAWDRSLAYLKGGTAWTADTYTVMANTGAAMFGADTMQAVPWGWTAGIGVEYALTDRWSTFAEYDHLAPAPKAVVFPAIAPLVGSSLGVSPSIDLFKMGLNYKFALGSTGTL